MSNNLKLITMDNKERFKLWLLKMGNIHTADTAKMTEAYKLIIEY